MDEVDWENLPEKHFDNSGAMLKLKMLAKEHGDAYALLVHQAATLKSHINEILTRPGLSAESREWMVKSASRVGFASMRGWLNQSFPHRDITLQQAILKDADELIDIALVDVQHIAGLGETRQ